MWENNLGVSDVEGYKRKKGVGRYWKYIKLCAALLLYLPQCAAAHVQARAGYAAAFLNDRAVTAKEAEQICEAEAEQEYPAAICFFKEQPDTLAFLPGDRRSIRGQSDPDHRKCRAAHVRE